MSLYTWVGGAPTFAHLVDAFYAGVESDPVLRPLYPQDLEGPKERLTLFLMQYFGGPTTYSEQRGHPRLRMRHVPFVIGQVERDAWVRHMSAAVDAAEIEEPARTEMLRYFNDAATFMINQEPSKE